MQSSKRVKISVKNLEKYTRKIGKVFLKNRNTFFQKGEIWTGYRVNIFVHILWIVDA
ncbi:MAG: hypothetical protein FWC47_16400 [Oscillospiraceae bacterium]|nr:hypothetical protein [Oscillospiraceae bacterium]